MREWLMTGIPRNIAENPDMEVVGRIRESLRNDTGQTCESDMLLPCPFCGGEASIVGKRYEAKFCVGCGDDSCLGFSGLGWLYDSEQEAAEAWNRRAERTCRWQLVEGTLFATECGEAFHRVVPDGYCPNCGAKVVER